MTFEDAKREIGRYIVETMVEKKRYQCTLRLTDIPHYAKIDGAYYNIGSERDWDEIDNDQLLWNRSLDEDEIENNPYWESDELKKEIASFVEAYATQWD